MRQRRLARAASQSESRLPWALGVGLARQLELRDALRSWRRDAQDLAAVNRLAVPGQSVTTPDGKPLAVAQRVMEVEVGAIALRALMGGHLAQELPQRLERQDLASADDQARQLAFSGVASEELGDARLPLRRRLELARRCR